MQFPHNRPMAKGVALRLAVLPLLLVSFVACSSIDCPVQTTVEVHYKVCQFEGTTVANDTLTDTLYVWTKRRDGSDTLLLNRGVNLSSFALQISDQHPEDMLIMMVGRQTQVRTLDTVWIEKEDIPHFESVDCAAHFFHKLTAVRSTHRAIDSIAINNPSVTYDADATNIYISFK